jgi:molybdate transport system ATP-binding protein
MEEQKGRITVVFGPNGSGKSQYAEKLRRQMASDRVRYLAFSDAYGPATDKAYYLQLRWNQHDIDQETPLVADLLNKAYQLSGEDTTERRQQRDELYAMFDMQPLLDKYVILLSSGELRKFQLIKTLLALPHTLILDNPFIGLDALTRQQLHDLLLRLAREQGLHLYLLLSKSDDMPDYADEIIRMGESAPYSTPSRLQELLQLPTPNSSLLTLNSPVIDMHHVSIRYGNRTIINDLNWQVRNGERWSLSGRNGSGKSTLLSLVCADNPQSYACDITLFGRQRGSGESIWEIKRHIGYVSPEMHRSYQRDLPALNVVASGLKDTVGLYVRPNAEEKEICRWWMRLFGIEELAERSFLRLSSGEQRMVLVARAFVKDPELLILDEPLHGLDDNNRQLVRHIIDTFCQRPGKTLVMVTHYEEELPSCIDHHLHLDRIPEVSL